MAELKNIKKPSVALVKLVEATGILLGIPLSPSTKSKYKAPTPSNYDDTVEYLSTKLYYAINALVSQGDADISNEVAFDLYAKVLEPGFNYEDAVRDGGLISRELFNLVYLILLKLQADKYRIPVRQINVTVVVDGSRSSYVALDIASHVFCHGTFTVCALTVGSANATSPMRDHLYADISRRCKLQYKISEHNFRVEAAAVDSVDETVGLLTTAVYMKRSDILVLGMSDCNVGEDSTAATLLWACWTCLLPVLLVKGSARTRPFSSVACPRVYQLCVKSQEHLKDVFSKALVFLKPGDSVVVVSLLKTKGDRADSRETRYENGARCGWVTGPSPLLPDFGTEYSEEYAESLRNEMQLFIEKGQVSGHIRIEPLLNTRTVAQSLCQIAYEEGTDVLVLHSKTNREVITECTRECPCSVAIVK